MVLFHRSISSIKGELIPYLVNKQFQEKKKVDSLVAGSADTKTDVQESGNSKIGRDYAAWQTLLLT